VIGVLSNESECRSVREFFELFKTPWEFWRPDRTYDVLLATTADVPEPLNSGLLLIFSSRPHAVDEGFGILRSAEKQGDWVEWKGDRFPIYGNVAAFASPGAEFLDSTTKNEVVVTSSRRECTIARIGYDLFQEVEFLLRRGQPPENAAIPTLDLHVSLLRGMMISAGIGFIEIPPVPHGYDFTACLTHDVDFIGIKDHKLDHTMWGFLYRSLVGSVRRAFGGDISWGECIQCWKAAFSLPLVHLGLCEDFWLEFDRYLEIEKKFGSTFYFIPFKGVAGTKDSTAAPGRRAAKYDLAANGMYVRQLLEAGCEVGLHGLDAWNDEGKARAEAARVRQVTGSAPIGTRMHWLYWTEDSPKSLEKAGFGYDSTFGYNEAVGFRAGTTQPFRPLNAENLMELPLNIQDSAMFYSDRMKLSEDIALDRCRKVLQSAQTFGGSITVNWHTRSLSPERLWGEFYAKLLNEFQQHRVWWGKAQEVVAWFRKRRAVAFDSVEFGRNQVRVGLQGDASLEDSFTVRVYTPGDHAGTPIYTDLQWQGEKVLEASF
jgi:hypothetical protein